MPTSIDSDFQYSSKQQRDLQKMLGLLWGYIHQGKDRYPHFCIKYFTQKGHIGLKTGWPLQISDKRSMHWQADQNNRLAVSSGTALQGRKKTSAGQKPAWSKGKIQWSMLKLAVSPTFKFKLREQEALEAYSSKFATIYDTHDTACRSPVNQIRDLTLSLKMEKKSMLGNSQFA